MNLFNWKKKYLKLKIRGVEKAILDDEFKRFKLLETREDIRQNYDGLKSRVDILKAKIESEKANNEKTASQDDLVRLEADIKKREDQMSFIDLEVYGSGKTQDHPEGYEGVEQQLEALRELKSMLEQYLKTEL